MSQTDTHAPIDDDDPQPYTTWLTGFIGLFMLVAVIAGVTAFAKMLEQDTRADAITDATPMELRMNQAREQQRLDADAHREQYLDIDGNVAERIVIPLDDAIDATIETYGNE